MTKPWNTYAFDNYFKGADREYSLFEQWDTLKALGYDKYYFSLSLDKPESWEGLYSMREHSQRTGLGVAAVYTILNLEQSTPSCIDNLLLLLTHLKSGDTLELAISYGWEKELSNASLDAQAIKALESILSYTAKHGITLSLYHHFGFWMERIEDCVRLAEKINQPNVKVTFCGYHWYVIDGGNLAVTIEHASPWLHMANLCGSSPTPEGSMPASIEPVGRGEFPLSEYLKLLYEVGFRGDIGFQGYNIGGNPATNLRESIQAFTEAVLEVDS